MNVAHEASVVGKSKTTKPLRPGYGSAEGWTVAMSATREVCEGALHRGKALSRVGSKVGGRSGTVLKNHFERGAPAQPTRQGRKKISLVSSKKPVSRKEQTKDIR